MANANALVDARRRSKCRAPYGQTSERPCPVARLARFVLGTGDESA